MGQYQQWLLAQDISQNLKAEVETLETELLYLKDRIAILEQAVPEGENVILFALQAYLHSSMPETGQAPVELEYQYGSSDGRQAQAGWDGLPGADTPLAEPIPAFSDLPSQRLVEKDMPTSFAQRRQTDPHLASTVSQSEYAGIPVPVVEERPLALDPLDKETRRLNENIQRWFDRWHRQIRGRSRTEEVSDER
jgi:hypothetical protein